MFCFFFPFLSLDDAISHWTVKSFCWIWIHTNTKRETDPRAPLPFYYQFFPRPLPWMLFLWSKFSFHQGACLHALLPLLWAMEANCTACTLAHSACFYTTELKTRPTQAPGRGLLIRMPHFPVRKLKLPKITSGGNTQHIFILWVTQYYCLTSNCITHTKKSYWDSDYGWWLLFKLGSCTGDKYSWKPHSRCDTGTLLMSCKIFLR